MKKRRFLTIVLAISMIASQSAFAFAAEEAVQAESEGLIQESADELLSAGEYAENQLIVVFNDDVSDSKIENIVEQQDAQCTDITEVNDDIKAAQVEISEETSMEEAIENFSANPKVEYVQPNYKYSFDEQDKYLDSSLKVGYQYQFEQCNIFGAWDELYKMENREKVTVAVMDTGVDVKHEDLQANLKYKDKYIQTLSGKRKAAVKDSGDHGTHVSGIIGATYDNGIGGSGVAAGYQNDLIDLIVVGTSPDGEGLYTMDIVAAIDYCIEEKADVINMSFGGDGRDKVMEASMKKAYDEGIVLVAASGNEDASSYTSPGSFKEVIAVNATNKQKEPTYWSNFGVWTDISAPGNNIMSAKPGNGYQLMSGTSMATPVTTGIIALIKAANPQLTPAQIANILCATASKPEGSKEFTEQLAYGIADAEAAVKAAMAASDTIDVESIYAKEAEATVDQFDNISLETLVRPATSLKAVTWESDNTEVATVDGNGTVVGVSEGTCNITATAGDKSVTTKVTVKGAVKPESIEIKDKDTLEKVVVGEIIGLSAKVLPENATNMGYHFEVSDTSVAGVDDYGELLIFTPGTFTLSVKTDVGEAVDSVEIVATKAAEDVKITSSIATAKIGDTYNYKAKMITEDNSATNDEPMWFSTNTKVATIDEETGKMTAMSEGITYIKVYGSCSYYLNSAACVSKKLVVGKANYTAKEIGLSKSTITYNSAKLKWNKIPNASKYVVSRATSKNGTYKTVKTITNASTVTYTDKGLTTGKTYYYKVKALFRDGSSLGTSSVVSAKPALKAPASLKLAAGKSQIKVSYGKVTGANGYTIYRATKKTGTYKAVKTLTGTSYTNKSLTKGKTYYFKVRAYRNVNGKKVYGPYSSIKSANVK